MNFSELSGSRFELAMERLRAGDQVTYESIGLVLSLEGVLVCELPSTWGPEYVTTKRAEDDFARAEATLKDLLDQSPEFRRVVGPKQIRYELIYDYGKGGILLCHKDHEGLHWAEGYPEQAG